MTNDLMTGPFQRDKRIRQRIFFIRLVIFAKSFFPFLLADFREKAVAVEFFVYDSKVDTIG